MTDEAYRPQKKSINPSEIKSEQAEGQKKLQEIADVREAAASELGGNEAAPPAPAFTPSNPLRENPEALPMTGTPPPAFVQARKQLQQEQDPNQVSRGPQPRPAAQTSELRITGSDRLEELMRQISSTTAIYEPIQLPSKGKFYNGEDGPTDGIIHIRPMTGEEEQILATPRFVKQGKAINMIFNRCIQGQAYNSERFLTQDRTYLLIYLRGISYTPEYDVEVKCPETDKQFATIIDLNALYVDYCPVDFTYDSLKGKLPTSGFNFTYRLSKGADEQRVSDYRERRIKMFDTAGQPDDTLLYRTALLIEEIEEISDKEEIKMLLKKLPINDVAYLRTVVNEPPFGVDTTVQIVSPFTMSEFEVELPLESNFFFPRARMEKQTTE